MRKVTFRPLWLLALPTVLALASCAERDNPVVDSGDSQTVVAPDKTVPTDDQMAVTVSDDVSVAVLRDFDEGSTGAALARRVPKRIRRIAPDTRMALVPGSLFAEGSDMTREELDAIVRLTLNGGYLAMERPTGEQLANFALLYLAKLFEMQMLDYMTLFDMDEAAAARAARSSELTERTRTRLANIRQMARTRAAATEDDTQAEMLIFGETDYFMQKAFQEETTVMTSETDSEGNTTQPVALTTKQERTRYVSGQLADASAEWLNSVEARRKAPGRARSITRASGSSAVNELMDASETFTYSEPIDWRDWDNDTRHYYNRVNMTVRSWGIHNMESNKDYYYLKQNVTLKMGEIDGWKIFRPLGENNWYDASGYGDYDCWYGSFLSQYITSMNLTGSGSIQLEASLPSTDNNTSSASVSIGSSSSKSVTNGLSSGLSFGASPSFSISGSHSEGTTEGTSFTLGMSQTSKDLGVKKNTAGSQVTWTYTGTLPQFYTKKDGNKYYYYHQTAADILTNDCDVTNEICWSVANPSGQYSIDITSQPQTAALLFSMKLGSIGNRPSKYEYTTRETAHHSQQLLEPNRAMQTWRMNITIDEWEGSPIAGALGELESNIRNAFPDLYANVFQVADKTATSLNTITAIVNYTKQVMNNRLDILQSYARSWGIKQFTIHWSCDNMGVKTREGLVVSTKIDLSTLTSDYVAQDGEVFTGTLNYDSAVKISIADGATITLYDATIWGTDYEDCMWAGLNCLGNATIVIEGENIVSGFYQDYPGIHIPSGKTLTIKGSGEIDLENNGRGAGIGGGYHIDCGNIVIESGKVNAHGNGYVAGIGGGYEASCGNITITGGTVYANAGAYAPGIGSGYKGSCGDITITDGVTLVESSSGSDAPYSIGPGEDGTCGTVTIGGKVTGPTSEKTYTYRP